MTTVKIEAAGAKLSTFYKDPTEIILFFIENLQKNETWHHSCNIYGITFEAPDLGAIKARQCS
jgi:hypothetical protein